MRGPTRQDETNPTDHDPPWIRINEVCWTSTAPAVHRCLVTSTVLPLTTAAWDEPEGIAPRGTVIVLSGRGESAASYGRLGRRISADAYKVRVVEIDLDDPAATRGRDEELLEDTALPAPRVLLGSDAGATLATALLDPLPVDAAVLAGLALPTSGAPAGS